MSGIDYQALRATVSMEQVLALLHFEPISNRGGQLRGPCPIHDPAALGDRRCFSVSLNCQVFRCVVCGAQGNHLDLWRLAHRLPLYQAALDLCRRAAIDPPRKASLTHRQTPEIRNSAPSSPRSATG